MSPLPIYKLPAALQTYEAERVEPAPAEECIICYRTYGWKDDDDDPHENP